jgi:triacylglycerol lipase
LSVNPSDTIVLVPGLLGFGSFGPKNEPPKLSYFRHVCEALAHLLTTELGLPSAPHFLVHEPPPTGPLAERVASLWQAIDGVLTRDQSGRARVHIVGHSTGGLDARLLVNPLYLPEGGPTSADKQRIVARLGGVVSLSAPHRGAPIAYNLGPLVPHLIEGPVSGLISWLYLVSILNTARSRKLVDHARYLMTALLALPKSLVMPVTGSRELLELTTELDAETADQIRRFLQRVVDDNRLVGDLAPEAMRELNARIATGDTFPIHSFVSVSPEPRLWPPEPTRLLYAAIYEAARPREGGEPFPEGEWIGPAAPALATKGARDGVVTSASQPAPAVAAARRPVRLIEGDHLDVVGHFEGVGETFFKSEANMTRERFYDLWGRVARSL